MNEKINFEILNGFINMIIIDVAQKYILKLKAESKKPPKLIEDYLDLSVYLIKKYQANIEIIKMRDTIINLKEEKQKEFKKLFKQYHDYASLCKELNFAFLLMIDKNLQEKALPLIYDNVYEYKILINQDIITKKQIKIDNVIKKSNEDEINKLHFYKNISSNYMTL